MSSASNITDSSSVPAEATPSFFRRITNAYGAAIAELLSPSPSSSPRRAGRPPDPTEADPGLYPNVTYRARLPPPEINVETVYTIESSPGRPSINGANPFVSDSSGHQSPISLVGLGSHDLSHVNHGPPVSTPRDAFANAYPRDPDVSLIAPNTFGHQQMSAQTDSYVHDFTNNSSGALLSCSHENPVQPRPSLSVPSPDNNVASNHGLHRSAPEQRQTTPQLPVTATSPSAVANAINGILHEAPVGSVAPSTIPLSSPSRPAAVNQQSAFAVVPNVTWQPSSVVHPSTIGSFVPQDHAPASVVPQQAPAPFQTPWSVSARAAAVDAASNTVSHSSSVQPALAQQSVTDFTAYRPAPFYASNTNGFPGFETFGAAPVPSPISSGGLDLLAVPRAVRGGTSMARHPRVSKHDRGSSAVDIEKIVNIATASLPSECSLRYISSAGILTPSEYSPKIAEYFTTMDLTLEALWNRFVDYDMLAPVEMYEFSNPVTGEHGGRRFNLLRDSHLVPLESVLHWQYFCKSLFTPPDQLSDGMVQQLVLKTLHHTVRQDVNYDLAALPEHQRGGATTIKLAMDKLSSDSFELRICIQQGITMFSITLYPKQDVTLAGQHVKTLAKILVQQNDLPPRAVRYVLKGMARSSHEGFNALCESIIMTQEMNYAPPAPGTNAQRSDYDELVKVVATLTRYYRDHLQSGDWPAALKDSTSITTLAAAPKTPALDITSDDFKVFAAALASQLSAAASPKKGPSKQFPCKICGSDEHWANKCPNRTSHPDSTPGSRAGSRSASRQGSRSNSRSNSKDNSRGRSSSILRKPGGSRGSSKDKSVAFDASVHNVIADFPTAADLLLGIYQQSKE